MYDPVAIETINFEQLATATDRLLLYRGQVPQHRPSTKQIGPGADGPERTVIVRPRRRSFDRATVLISSVATGLFVAFAALAALA